MGDSREELRFTAIGEDKSAGRMFDGLANKADDAKDEVKGLDKQLGELDIQLIETQLHMAALIAEFDRTGDKTLFKEIRRDKSTINLLEGMKQKVAEVGEETVKTGKAITKNIEGSFGDALQSLPAQVKGAGILAIAGLGVALSPVFGAMISGAILGGVGAGGIIGGIALAAQDSTVQTEANKLGQQLKSSFGAAGQPFVLPLLNAFDQLDGIADHFASKLGKNFEGLATTIQPLVHGVEGFIDNLGPGLDKAFDAAQPAIRAIAKELPNLGDAIGDFLTMISDNSDGAIEGLIGLLRVVEFGIRVTGFLVAVLSTAFETLVNFEGRVLRALDFLGPAFDLGADGAEELQQKVKDVDSSSTTYVGTVDYLSDALNNQAAAAEASRNALNDLADAIADQFDPTANLVHRLDALKKAQKDYADAIKEHGRNSEEAKDALLKVAEAAVAVNSAALNAQGTFDGKFSPAIRKILTDADLTEAEIRDLEKAFEKATTAGNAFAKTYKAKLILDTRDLYGSLAAARNALENGTYVSGRASGGDVKRGKTYLVGERGPELVTFGEDGYVHNAANTAALMSGSSGGSSGPGFGGPGFGSPAPQPIYIVFPGTTGDPIFDAVLRKLREGVRVEGAGDVELYFTGTAA